MAKVKALAVTAITPEVKAMLDAGSFKPTERTYVPETPLLTLSGDQWELVERTVNPKNGGAAFSVLEARFKIGKDEYARAFRSGEEPEAGDSISIDIYVAKR